MSSFLSGIGGKLSVHQDKISSSVSVVVNPSHSLGKDTQKILRQKIGHTANLPINKINFIKMEGVAI